MFLKEMLSQSTLAAGTGQLQFVTRVVKSFALLHNELCYVCVTECVY